MKLSSSFTCCNDDIKPSAAFSCRHIKYKIHAPECTKTRNFYFKNSKISPLPQRKGDTPSRTHTPRRLRRLDLRAFGAHSRTPHSEVWLRAWTSCILYKSLSVTVAIVFKDNLASLQYASRKLSMAAASWFIACGELDWMCPCGELVWATWQCGVSRCWTHAQGLTNESAKHWSRIGFVVPAKVYLVTATNATLICFIIDNFSTA